MKWPRLLVSLAIPGVLGLGMFLAGGAMGKPALPLPADAAAQARQTVIGSRYTDVAGKLLAIGHGGVEEARGVAFVFINTECPISNGLTPELNRIAKVAAEKHVEFYAVLSDPTVTRAAAQKHAKEFQIAFSEIFDASGTLAAALEPKVTPHAYVMDAMGKVVYNGRVDDSYGAAGKQNGVTKKHDFEDAIVAVSTNRAAVVSSTEPVGCIFESWKRPAKETKVTWSRDIAPIVYANCAVCHHEGEVAPFSLMKYQDASKRAEMLAAVTDNRLMPPWKATDAWGTFHDERRLTDAQIALFKAWAEAGAPEGDKADAPPPPTFANKWQLGTPDLVVKMSKAFNVPASGRDLMTFHVVPLNLPDDKYVVAFEYHPGNRRVVHHMIAFLDATGTARQLAKERGDGVSYVSFGGPGFIPTGGLGGWAPGATPRFLPEGVGHPVRKGSDLVLNIHYHPSGKPESDQGELALYFAKKPVQQISLSIPLTNRQIDIAPGDNNYIRTASITAPVDLTLQGITPHMHMIGREMKVTATFPDGKSKQLIYVNDWDWNWQDQYQYAEPIKIPRGTKVDLWARYDNSKENPKNPQDPPKRVTFGEQTTNEMCFAFLQLTVDGLRAPALGQLGQLGQRGAATQPGGRATPILERLEQLRDRQNRGGGGRED